VVRGTAFCISSVLRIPFGLDCDLSVRRLFACNTTIGFSFRGKHKGFWVWFIFFGISGHLSYFLFSIGILFLFVWGRRKPDLFIQRVPAFLALVLVSSSFLLGIIGLIIVLGAGSCVFYLSMTLPCLLVTSLFILGVFIYASLQACSSKVTRNYYYYYYGQENSGYGNGA